MLTFPMLFNLVIASGTIGVLIYIVHSIVKKQIPSIPILLAFGFALYELIATQYLLPYMEFSVATQYGYFSREANITGLPFYLGALLIGYGLFTTIVLGKKAPICSRLNFKQSMILVAVLIGLAHPVVGVVAVWVTNGGILLFGATAIGYLVNVMLSFLLYLYKNISLRHDAACRGENCVTVFPFWPLVNTNSASVLFRSFVFGASVLNVFVLQSLSSSSVMQYILVFFGCFASLMVIIGGDKNDGASPIGGC